MPSRVNEILFNNLETAYFETAILDVDDCQRLEGHITVTVTTPSAFTFVDGDVSVADNTITKTAHGCKTGLKVAASNSGGALPGGTSATTYYIIRVDADTVKLATSQANALAGTAVDITSAAGGGTHTLTPNVTVAGTIKLQKNIEPGDQTAIWSDILLMSASISGAGTTTFSLSDFCYQNVRLHSTFTSGQVSLYARIRAETTLG